MVEVTSFMTCERMKSMYVVADPRNSMQLCSLVVSTTDLAHQPEADCMFTLLYNAPAW